jgi:geranylgeranylglycerol-phosphate geranylgeranyltransferase
MAIPFVYGSVAVGGRLSVAIVVLSSIAFLAGVGREVLKGIMDYEGDAVRDTKTIARTMGISYAARISALCILAAVSLSPIPFLSKASGSFHHNLSYMGPVLLTDLMLTYVTFRLLGLSRPEEAARLRHLSLLALTVGLIGFLLGAV